LFLITTSPPTGGAGTGGAAPVSLHLFVSEGTWLSPEGTTSPAGSSLDVQIVDGAAFSAAFVAGTSPQPAWVYVSRGDADQSFFVPMNAAAVAGIELSSVPAVLKTSMTNQVQLTAQVLAQNGALPSDGTLVNFAVVPPTAGVEIFSPISPLDSTGKATAMLVLVPQAPDGGAPDAGPSYTGPPTITVQATATPPGKPGTPMSQMIGVLVSP
jgi:hypothetical protein